MTPPFFRERKIHFVSSIFLCTSTALIARSFVSQTPQHEKLYPLHHNTVFEFGQYKSMTLEQIAQENASYILWCTTNIKKILIPRQPLNISYDYYAQSNFSRTPKAHLQLLCAVCTLAHLNALRRHVLTACLVYKNLNNP
jgi:hypothetical protein